MDDITLVGTVVARLERAEPLPPEAFQALFGAVIRAYSWQSESTADHVVPYSARENVRPTDVLRTTAGLLRESDISSFELAMIMNL